MNSKDKGKSIRTFNAFKERVTLLASCNYKATNEEPGNSFDLMFLVCQRKKKKRSPE